MEVAKMLHMEGGTGQTSYARNSLLQRIVYMKTQSILEDSIKELYKATSPNCLVIADLGCSSGHNSLMMVLNLNFSVPEFIVFLNDLPGNDFNTLFKFVSDYLKRLEEEKGSEFGPCLISGIPKSFYGRLFPSKSLHFIHSCYSLHFLSKVPKGLMSDNGEALNKGNIYIAKTSTIEVWKAYYAQFESDFTLFLKSRSKEIVPGGGMVLTFLGSINSHDPDNIYEFIGITLSNMASEGLIEEVKLDKFNLPFYAPTAEEVIGLIKAEGSFILNKLEKFTIDWDAGCNSSDLHERGKFIADTMRAVAEPMLASEFGEDTMDELFIRFKELVMGLIANKKKEYFNLVISLTSKKDSKSE
ncbi:hypothetical protein Nepgr_004994 [Nepenthes gracilis]|uniref:Uncharacterized protein n=1 Tax=Nepenthes gracilis TaxID=150966 RepID=A0AAD3S2F6_NEPGR|nr:hypothetical protein Nepgr_004994 [Nepenthes gracilis]